MKKTVAIIGGGPAGMALGCFLNKQKFDVTIYEKNKGVGRKFLVAGKGGFNLTHSEEMSSFAERYSPSSFLKSALGEFSNSDFRKWLLDLDIPTFIGSSKRVYPKSGIKPIEVLQKIEKLLSDKEVKIQFNKAWTGFDSEQRLCFSDGQYIEADHAIFALGGGSWKVTGSDGKWLDYFKTQGIESLPFQASNCGFKISWELKFIQKHEGLPLKNISISCNGLKQKGEAVITNFGLEGNAIYALSPQIRAKLSNNELARITIDLKPALSEADITLKLSQSKLNRVTDILRKELKLSKAQIGLLKTRLNKESFLNSSILAAKMKALDVDVSGIAKIDEAISTVGGISLEEVDQNFQLKKLTNNYCIGEMLNWDAPTGGYLLHACFSMGKALANHLNSQKTENCDESSDSPENDLPLIGI